MTLSHLRPAQLQPPQFSLVTQHQDSSILSTSQDHEMLPATGSRLLGPPHSCIEIGYRMPCRPHMVVLLTYDWALCPAAKGCRLISITSTALLPHYECLRYSRTKLFHSLIHACISNRTDRLTQEVSFNSHGFIYYFLIRYQR